MLTCKRQWKNFFPKNRYWFKNIVILKTMHQSTSFTHKNTQKMYNFALKTQSNAQVFCINKHSFPK